MQTHEDPEVRRRFDIVNRILGWGNPCVPIWFIGLEEAGEWEDPLSSENKETLDKYEKCPDGWFSEENGQIEIDAREKKNTYTKVYEIMSKLLAQVIDGDFNRWKEYCDTIFIDGVACQANLYPLAKKKRKGELPEHYKNLFGFGPKDGERYREIVRKTRFPELRKSWEQTRPAITVCFGDAEEDIKDVFGTLLGANEAEFKVNKCICSLYSSGIIMTPFFARYLMPNECIRSLAECVRPLWNRRTP